MPTTPGLSIPALVPTTLALESLETAGMDDGDLGFVTTGDIYYSLDIESVAARTGSNVLWTRNSNPLFNGGIATYPGRWVLLSGALGCSCPTGPTGAPGALGPVGPAGPIGPTPPLFGNTFVYRALDVDTTLPTPGPFLFALPALVAPTAGSMDADLTYAANDGPGDSLIRVQLYYSINAGAPVAIGIGGAADSSGTGEWVAGAITGVVPGLTPGNSVVVHAEIFSTQAGATINPVSRSLSDHLAVRVRFYGV